MGADGKRTSIEGPIVEGEELWWAPHDPRSFERVKVTGVAERDGVVYVQTEDVRTRLRYWNREVRVRALCCRPPKRVVTPKRMAVAGVPAQ